MLSVARYKNEFFIPYLTQADLYLIHREDPCFNPWETARALKDLKKEGLVKEVGVSNFDPFKFDALNKAMEGGWLRTRSNGIRFVLNTLTAA